MPLKYRSSLKQADFLTAVTPITAGKWVEIGERKIEAGVYYQMGFGFSSAMSDADGRFYAALMDSTGAPGAALQGTLRIAAYTPDDLPIRVLGEWPTNKLASSASDMTKQLPMPVDNLALGQDYKFKLFFKADANGVGNGNISNVNTVISLDVTKVSKAG